MPTIDAPAWFRAALDALRAGDIDGFLQIYAEDAVHEFPFAPAGAPQRLDGKPAIAAYMRQLPSRVRIDGFADLRVREVGDELIVEATGRGQRSNGEPFHVQYVWFITHDHGRVSRFRDYMHRRA